MLKVIGVGFGRTGTSSTKLALEMLGIAPCHHMSALVDNQALSQRWYDVVFQGKRNWDELFAGFQATLDWPAAFYWQELAAFYPQAKLLLTLRDPEKWYDSMRQTVFPQMEKPLGEVGSAMWLRRSTSIKLIREDTFAGRGFHDKAYVIHQFEEHNAKVQATFGPDRLLVWQVQDGWEPLCRFLEIPAPDEPFPRSNSAVQFPEMFARDPL